jgi:hypothetical protein
LLEDNRTYLIPAEPAEERVLSSAFGLDCLLVEAISTSSTAETAFF